MKVVYLHKVNAKTVFESYPDPKNSPSGPQNVKIDSKIRSKSKVRVEETIENKSLKGAEWNNHSGFAGRRSCIEWQAIPVTA